MRVQVIAHPNSKRPRIEIDLLDNLHVYINAPPLEGRANMEIALALAKYFKVKNYEIELEHGKTSRNKTYTIVKDNISNNS